MPDAIAAISCAQGSRGESGDSRQAELPHCHAPAPCLRGESSTTAAVKPTLIVLIICICLGSVVAADNMQVVEVNVATAPVCPAVEFDGRNNHFHNFIIAVIIGIFIGVTLSTYCWCRFGAPHHQQPHGLSVGKKHAACQSYVEKQDVICQSQCTYTSIRNVVTPRFHPLPNLDTVGGASI